MVKDNLGQAKQCLINVINKNMHSDSIHDVLIELINNCQTDLSNNNVNYAAASFETKNYNFYVGYYAFTKELFIELNKYSFVQVFDANADNTVNVNSEEFRIKAEMFYFQQKHGNTVVKHGRDGQTLIIDKEAKYPIVTIDKDTTTNFDYPADQKQKAIDAAKSSIYEQFVSQAHNAIAEYQSEQANVIEK